MRNKKRGTLSPAQSSIVLHITPILALRSIKNPYTFLLSIGISRTSATKMLQGKAVQINFRQLTALCLHLNCTPNDLFALREMQLPENHQLHQLQDFAAPIINPEDFYRDKSPEEIRAMQQL